MYYSTSADDGADDEAPEILKESCYNTCTTKIDRKTRMVRSSKGCIKACDLMPGDWDSFMMGVSDADTEGNECITQCYKEQA